MTTFFDPFTGNPPSPEPFSSPQWDIAIHMRDRPHWYEPIPLDADHGMGCEPPPAQHLVDSFDQMVYRCNSHIMTAINGDYGMVTLTPNHALDVAAGGYVQWEMSTGRKNAYDWIEIWISPLNNHFVHPTNPLWGQIQGPPRNGIFIALIPAGINRFDIHAVRGFELELLRDDNLAWTFYDQLFEPSFTERKTFRIDLSQTALSLSVVNYNDAGDTYFWAKDFPLDPPLPWRAGVVQFTHHSFHPTNACNDDGTCAPQAWHWDNVEISPAIPFRLIKGDVRYAEPGRTKVTLTEPTPDRAFLRFSGIAGEWLNVRYQLTGTDEWSGWLPARKQPQLEDEEGRFHTYLMPIPRNVTAVEFDAANWWAGDWHVRDVSVWTRVEALM